MFRKVCVVTGTRAEYGLLYWLMEEIQNDQDLELQLIVTGMHLSPEFGLTYKMIEKDGFSIQEKVEMLLAGDSPVAIAKSIGLGVIGFADCLQRLKPDILVVLGDRYEIFAAAQAAMALNIPIAHISGGETTAGAMDEAMRHAISKMAHFHFVGAAACKQRVIQLGEQPERVYLVGEPGLENIRRQKLLTKSELGKWMGITLREPIFLITYHPVTLEKRHSEYAINQLLEALEAFSDGTCIFTMPNSDADGRVIMERIRQFVTKKPDSRIAFTSMGQINYLSAMQWASVVIGNSSSGLIEAPYFRIPTVNIGNRQKGRLRTESVLDCEEEAASIMAAIEQVLTDEFKERVSQASLTYMEANTAEQIVKHLKSVDLSNVLMKEFYDIIL